MVGNFKPWLSAPKPHIFGDLDPETPHSKGFGFFRGYKT